jgi:hypothetical protein
MARVCRYVLKRVLSFGISKLTVLACVARYRTVSRGWFAIWFADFLPIMSAYLGKADLHKARPFVRL